MFNLGGILRNITATMAPGSEMSLIHAYATAHGVSDDEARRTLIVLGAQAAGLHTASPLSNIGSVIGKAVMVPHDLQNMMQQLNGSLFQITQIMGTGGSSSSQP